VITGQLEYAQLWRAVSMAMIVRGYNTVWN
jgi:hypothetical protein